MTTRFRAALCLPLLLTACDNRQEKRQSTEEKPQAPSVTKTQRPEIAEKSETLVESRKALAAVRDLPAGEERDQRLAEWVWEAYELDPELAKEGFAQLAPGSEERNRLLQHVAMRLAELDPEQASTWAASLETDEEKSLAFGRIALALAEEHPEDAARLLSESGVEGRDFDVAVFQVIESWSSTAPENAAAWVASFDAGDTRQAGLRAVTGTWLPQDPATCVAWISSLQDETVRKEAINGYAEAVLQQPPAIRQTLLSHALPAMRSRFEELERRAREEEEN
ncbi:MAG: hypothetical protein EOP88_17295 [Verrucomicrobiaceae bacterium]|nr:MAG: hypothetical protein EOP88_17295 [Verrucomicrobiaceae bacterium]